MNGHDYVDKSWKSDLHENKENRVTAADQETRVKEEMECKICLANAVSILFLRCRHLTSCATCSSGVESCVVCRSKIDAPVRVFLT